MHEKQIDLSAQVARVKRRTRPWKSIIALLLAIAAAVISHEARRHSNTFPTNSTLTNQIVANGTAALFLILGSTATYGLASRSRQLLEPRAGTSHSAIVRYAILIVGGFTTLLITLLLFGVPVGQILLSGAVTSVFVGIAAQQALGNVFAGLVLVFARPFQVGEAIRLKAGALGGTLDGIVTEIGITYVRLDTGGSVMSVPNAQVLNAVIGPIPPEESGNGQAPVVTDGKSGTPGGPEQPQPSPPGPALPARPISRVRQRAGGCQPPALCHANRCGGRLSAKGTTRLQPNGIPRRQWVRPGGHSRTGHLLLTPPASSVFPLRRRAAVIGERGEGLARRRVRILVPVPGAAGRGRLAVPA
ncbi:MAG TPA: mechanosensitive ion channel family protein [Streptosporangiaceae bacterium]|nr:mechanosensitive ion channel family protein [Streptosporangiaceae bacterium]